MNKRKKYEWAARNARCPFCNRMGLGVVSRMKDQVHCGQCGWFGSLPKKEAPREEG